MRDRWVGDGGAISKRLVEDGRALTLSRIPQGGVGHLQATQPRAWRCSAARTCLWRGHSSLPFADASVMPVIVSGALNANCITFGERDADFTKAV